MNTMKHEGNIDFNRHFQVPKYHILRHSGLI